MPSPPPPRPVAGKIVGFVLLGLCALAIGGTVFVQVERQPETSPVSRGARLTEEAGCYACHGRSEEEPRFNLRQTEPGKWRSKNNPSFWESDITEVKVLVDWIANGVPAAEAEDHKKLLIRMPAYKDRLTPGEIEDIAAWILAEGLKLRVDPSSKLPGEETADGSDILILKGDRLSRRLGCYQCHGELGQGGVANPQSFKGYIPGFQGRDFLKLTANGDRAEILHWIDHGRGKAIEAGPLGRIAKKFLNGQAIPMPGYRDHLSVAEKELLADYLLLLNKTGPLSAQQFEHLSQLLAPSS